MAELLLLWLCDRKVSCRLLQSVHLRTITLFSQQSLQKIPPQCQHVGEPHTKQPHETQTLPDPKKVFSTLLHQSQIHHSSFLVSSACLSLCCSFFVIQFTVRIKVTQGSHQTCSCLNREMISGCDSLWIQNLVLFPWLLFAARWAKAWLQKETRHRRIYSAPTDSHGNNAAVGPHSWERPVVFCPFACDGNSMNGWVSIQYNPFKEYLQKTCFILFNHFSLNIFFMFLIMLRVHVVCTLYNNGTSRISSFEIGCQISFMSNTSSCGCEMTDQATVSSDHIW